MGIKMTKKYCVYSTPGLQREPHNTRRSDKATPMIFGFSYLVYALVAVTYVSWRYFQRRYSAVAVRSAHHGVDILDLDPKSLEKWKSSGRLPQERVVSGICWRVSLWL